MVKRKAIFTSYLLAWNFISLLSVKNTYICKKIFIFLEKMKCQNYEVKKNFNKNRCGTNNQTHFSPRSLSQHTGKQSKIIIIVISIRIINAKHNLKRHPTQSKWRNVPAIQNMFSVK